MKTQSQPLPGLDLTRTQWRCLRVVSEVRDIAHAARKLHWSQALLKSALVDLRACVGAQHIALSEQQVQLSPMLKRLIDEQPVCGQPVGLTNLPARTGKALLGRQLRSGF